MNVLHRAIAEYDVTLSMTSETGTSQECQGSVFHSPTPLCLHYVDLKDVFSDHPQVGLEDSLALCGTCRDNLRVFLSLMIASNGSLTWEIKRKFGNQIRALGLSIWGLYYEETSA